MPVATFQGGIRREGSPAELLSPIHKRMRPRPGLTTLSMLPILCGVGVSQASDPGPEVVSVFIYDQAQSRRLFASADRNADDRLDMSEAGVSLETVGGIRDRVAFRRLDGNRDGFMSWQEFDAHLRSVLKEGGTFYLVPVRPSELEVREMPEDDPAASGAPSALERLDTDGNGTVSRSEIGSLLAKAGLPPTLISQFPVLDVDKSGELSAVEVIPLAPVLARLGPPPGAVSGLPPRYRNADEDGDGQLNRDELEVCLIFLDPGLARWVDKVLQDADANGSGGLDQRELQRADNR